jgi:dimethylamine monooxygenase subunit A
MQPAPILQTCLDPAQRAAADLRLPQMTPVAEGHWLRIDMAYAAQLAEKARLTTLHRPQVIAALPGSGAAQAELLILVLDDLRARPGFHLSGDRVLRPDGETVKVDPSDPLLTLSRLVQEDFCIHQKRGDEHVLTAALLCFPSAWTLAEKIGRPLTRIHQPVARYDSDVAARVQRMFDMVRADRPLWRANMLRYDRFDLFQPHSEAAPRPVGTPASPYVRMERQTIRRLPASDAVVFSIHTTMVARATLEQLEHRG